MSDKKIIKIGFNPDFAPFSYAIDGKPNGILVDRVRSIFEKPNIPFEFIPVELTKLTESLLAGHVDILLAMAKTEQRMKDFSFSKPIIITGGGWFSLTKTPPLLDGEVPKSVVTPSFGPLVAQIEALFPDINLKTTENYDTALRTVLNGEAHAAALNWHVGRMMCDEKYPSLFRDPKAPFNNIPLSMVTSIKDPYSIIERLIPYISDDWAFDPQHYKERIL